MGSVSDLSKWLSALAFIIWLSVLAFIIWLSALALGTVLSAIGPAPKSRTKTTSTDGGI